MPVDPNNPAMPAPAPQPITVQSTVPEALVAVEVRKAGAAEKGATAQETMAAQMSQVRAILEQPQVITRPLPTEAEIFLTLLCACLNGVVARDSADFQTWAADLTKDYITRYPNAVRKV
jgi:hypothetical protein